jgi:hypothetical protein
MKKAVEPLVVEEKRPVEAASVEEKPIKAVRPKSERFVDSAEDKLSLLEVRPEGIYSSLTISDGNFKEGQRAFTCLMAWKAVRNGGQVYIETSLGDVPPFAGKTMRETRYPGWLEVEK